MDREITHLRALNHLAEHLNRSCDVHNLLATVVETLVQVMGLRTAWAFLWMEAGLRATRCCSDPLHDFALAACCGLPPGLERDNRGDLCRARLSLPASVASGPGFPTTHDEDWRFTNLAPIAHPQGLQDRCPGWRFGVWLPWPTFQGTAPDDIFDLVEKKIATVAKQGTGEDDRVRIEQIDDVCQHYSNPGEFTAN